MKLIRNLEDLPRSLCSGAVSIGNFDGVHRGHARIVEQLISEARRLAGPAVVLTFDPHPVRLLRPDVAPPPLTWTDRKAALLAELGVDVVIAYPTDEALLGLSPEEFFNEIVCCRLRAKALVEGPNFFFGRNRAGTIDRLRVLCEGAKIALTVVEPLEQGGELVSSSLIRRLVSRGDVDGARAMLTRPYRIRGMVTHGAGRGAKIGFPTANIEAVDTLLPAPGVYAGRAYQSGDGWPAAINLGPNPTFGEKAIKVEVHLIGFDGPLYGRAMEVDFLARLRDIHEFDSVEHLKRQLAGDIEQASEIARGAQ